MIVDTARALRAYRTILGAKAAPDGYTLTLAFVGTLSIIPHLPAAGFDCSGLTAVTRGPSSPGSHGKRVLTAKDVKELIAMPSALRASSIRIRLVGSQLAGELFNGRGRRHRAHSI